MSNVWPLVVVPVVRHFVKFWACLKRQSASKACVINPVYLLSHKVAQDW